MDKLINLLTLEFLIALMIGSGIAFSILDILFYRNYKKIDQKLNPDNKDSSKNIDKKSIGIKKPDFNFVAIILLNLIIVIIFIISFRNFRKTNPKIIETSPVNNSVLSDYKKPIEILFNVPIDFSKISVNVYPQSKHEWKFHQYLRMFPHGRKITFTPTVSYLPDQKIMIYLSNIVKPYSKRNGGEYLLEFKAPDLATAVSVDPKDGSDNVPTDKKIVTSLSSANGAYAEYDIKVNPETPFQQKKQGDKILVTFDQLLAQGTNYNINVFQTPVIYDIENSKVISYQEKKLLTQFEFKTVNPPFISSFLPLGESVLPNQPVEIVFDESVSSISSSGYIKFNPDIEGDFRWEDNDKKLIFTPTSWPKDTAITVTITKGLKNTLSGELEKDIVYRFKTIGETQVVQTSPQHESKGVSIDSSIEIEFDQEVDKLSAQSKFFISPETKGEFSWNNNIITFTPAPSFVPSAEYIYGFNEGIKSINGIDSVKKREFTFQTGSERFILELPYYRQEELFTCNIAALRMLLSYRGVDISESDLKNKIGTSGSRGDGDPNKGYIRDYGLHWDPIYKIASMFRPARLYKDWGLHDLLEEVAKGNPVMIWSQNGWSDPHEISWINPDGSHIYALNGMHSYVVVGHVGSLSNPSYIIVHDPWRGIYDMNTQNFVKLWNYFNTALVLD